MRVTEPAREREALEALQRARHVDGQDIASLAVTLSLRQAIAASLARLDPTATDPSQRILPAELVFLTPDIPDTLILTNIGA